MDPNKPVHPTFLYESLWCLIGFLILYVIYKKFRKIQRSAFPRLRRVVRAGQNDNRGLQNRQPLYRNTTIRVSQVVSGALMLVCLVLYIVFTVKYTKHPKPIEGVDYFPEDAVKTKKERLADEAAAMQAQTEETSAEKSEEVSEEARKRARRKNRGDSRRGEARRQRKNGINQLERVDKMAKLIDGKLISAEVLDSVRERVEYLKSRGVEPCLCGHNRRRRPRLEGVCQQ